MVEVGGLWEMGWSAPITEADLWEMVLRSYGVERLNMTPVSGIDKRWISEYHSMDELIESRDLTPVFIDENGETELSDFEHPENALYVLGKATYSPFQVMAQDHLSVRIDCPSMGMLWPHQALAVVLYDRSKK